MPAINSRCRQPHKPSFLLLDSFRPVFRQVLKSCTFLFFMLSGLLKPHNHPSLIPLISENQPFPAYSLLSFRECSSLLYLKFGGNAKKLFRFIRVRDGRFTVIYKTKSGMKESVFYRGPFIRKDKPNVPQADILPAYKRYDRPNRIAAKLRSKTCELCGQYTNDVEIHQVKRLKSLSGEYEWEKVMLKNRRKTLAVCPACHREIHGKD